MYSAEITMSIISMMMSIVFFDQCKKVLDFNAVNMLFMCKTGVKYQNASRAQRAYAPFLEMPRVCACFMEHVR